MTDGRHKRGVRDSVALLFTLLVRATLAGMTTPRAMAEWGRRLSRVAEKGSARDAGALSVRGDRKPTCSRGSLRSRVNEGGTQFVTRLGAMKRGGDDPRRLVGQAERAAPVPVALDGKTRRGTGGHEAAEQRQRQHLAL